MSALSTGVEEINNSASVRDVYSIMSREVVSLLGSPGNSHLEAGRDLHRGKLAASNIARGLAREFPGESFEILRKGSGRVSVIWSDGPSVDQVEALIGGHRTGTYVQQLECFVETLSAFAIAFGGTRLLVLQRTVSDEAIALAIAKVLRAAGLSENAVAGATPQAYRNGDLLGYVVDLPDGGKQSLQHLVKSAMDLLRIHQ